MGSILTESSGDEAPGRQESRKEGIPYCLHVWDPGTRPRRLEYFRIPLRFSGSFSALARMGS